MINFIEPSPLSKDNRWRNIFAIILLCGIVGFLLLHYFSFHYFADLKTYSAFLRPKNIGDSITPSELEQSYGGDAIFQPAIRIEPVLSTSSVAFDVERLSADYAIVKDKDSGRVLLAKQEYTEYPIASITKLMSALVLLEQNLNWDTTAQVIGMDSLDTHMYAGDTYSLDELWNAALIGSSNKAILTLVQAAGFSEEEFVMQMNEKTKELGMLNTRFTDSTGLDTANVSTASDLVLLLDEALTQERIKTTLLKNEYTLYSAERNKKHHMWNTNWLQIGWIPHSFGVINGGKTGSLPTVGYNFAVQLADSQGHIIDVVILGADSNEGRFVEAREVGKWVFNNYEWKEIIFQ